MFEHDDRPQVLVARAIAIAAHAGQTDKSGAAYIGHPARVAGQVTSVDAKAAGWLHDVVEDTPVTFDDLRAAGLPDVVVDAVDALTRRDGEQPDDYYARVAADPVAYEVKQADMADNANPSRLAKLDPQVADRLGRKYAEGRARLLELHLQGQPTT